MSIYTLSLLASVIVITHVFNKRTIEDTHIKSLKMVSNFASLTNDGHILR